MSFSTVVLVSQEYLLTRSANRHPLNAKNIEQINYQISDPITSSHVTAKALAALTHIHSPGKALFSEIDSAAKRYPFAAALMILIIGSHIYRNRSKLHFDPLRNDVISK